MALHVREIERGDLAVINRWRNDAEVVACLGANFFFIATEIDGRWYDRYLTERDKAVRLAMLDGVDGAVIGCVNLTNIHRINRAAEFSIVIGEKSYWGRGLGVAAAETMLKHGFLRSEPPPHLSRCLGDQRPRNSHLWEMRLPRRRAASRGRL